MWEVVTGMVITSEGQVDPDIYLQTPNQSTGKEDMIIITWSKEVLCRK